jgi:hypothetical protein
MSKKKKQEAILFGIVISGILIASSLLSISSQLIQEARAQNNINNQTTTNTTANQTDTDNATPPPSPSCCPSNGYIANAGPDQTVLEGTIITLNGSSTNNKSTNIGNNTVNYLWRQMAGPAIILNGNNTAHPTFVAPNYPNNTKYTFALEVFENQVNNNNNNQTGSAIDTVDIIVKDVNLEAKSPKSLQQEEDDNTTEGQSNQDELQDEGDEVGEGGQGEEQSDGDDEEEEDNEDE